jgi:endonuclease YncB( thermonuclease family)
VAFALFLDILSVASATATPAVLEPARIALSGIARVLDGDTIEVGQVRVRLEGIDAPEGTQACNRRFVGTWACGTAATYALIGLVQNREVACEDRGRDKYDRTLGICFVDGRDINAEMVRLGLAWAYLKYSRDYVAEEAEARAARRNIWVAETMPPWEWRAQQLAFRSATARAAVESAQHPAGCDIKGNVTRVGRIYHLPTSPWYDRIVMDESKGRRWFCSEGEAIAAGWRPVLGFGGG